MSIKLTKYQRDEIGHLYDIAEGESVAQHNDVIELAAWAFDAEAYRALLDGQTITPSQRHRLVNEVAWHRDKCDYRDSPGSHRSMNNLIIKLKKVRMTA